MAGLVHLATHILVFVRRFAWLGRMHLVVYSSKDLGVSGLNILNHVAALETSSGFYKALQRLGWKRLVIFTICSSKI